MGGLGKTVGKLAGGLFGGILGGADEPAPAPAPAPVVQSPPPMPIPDDKAVKDAQKRSILRQRRRSGRSSTILTDDTGDTLG